MAKRPDPNRKAIHWTDEDLDQLAEIGPEDIEEAKAWWRRNADPRFRELLDAEPLDDDPDPNLT